MCVSGREDTHSPWEQHAKPKGIIFYILTPFFVPDFLYKIAYKTRNQSVPPDHFRLRAEVHNPIEEKKKNVY